MPDNADVGRYWVNISVSDGHGGLDRHNFTLTVQNVNDPPIIHTKDVNTATQDVLYSVTYNATDPDGDSLTWSLKTDAVWLTLNGSTISETPTNADIGSYWVNISVSDGNGGVAWHNFTLTVENVNDPPVIQNFTVPKGAINMQYTLLITAKDPDKDNLTWRIIGSIWLSINNGLIIGIPKEAGNYSIQVIVSDEHGGMDTVSFTIYISADSDGDGVNNINDAYPLNPSKWQQPINPINISISLVLGIMMGAIILEVLNRKKNPKKKS
jgi:hypothetical protein